MVYNAVGRSQRRCTDRENENENVKVDDAWCVTMLDRIRNECIKWSFREYEYDEKCEREFIELVDESVWCR